MGLFVRHKVLVSAIIAFILTMWTTPLLFGAINDAKEELGSYFEETPVVEINNYDKKSTATYDSDECLLIDVSGIEANYAYEWLAEDGFNNVHIIGNGIDLTRLDEYEVESMNVDAPGYFEPDTYIELKVVKIIN